MARKKKVERARELEREEGELERHKARVRQRWTVRERGGGRVTES